MRYIRTEFRGKPILKLNEDMIKKLGENYKEGFVYGQLVYDNMYNPIIVGRLNKYFVFDFCVQVKPTTLGEYSFTDESGNRIFKGLYQYYNDNVKVVKNIHGMDTYIYNGEEE